MSKPMSEKDYWYWKGFLEHNDDLPDGAWFQACQNEIGSYDKMMAYLNAGEIYEKANPIKTPQEEKCSSERSQWLLRQSSGRVVTGKK